MPKRVYLVNPGERLKELRGRLDLKAKRQAAGWRAEATAARSRGDTARAKMYDRQAAYMEGTAADLKTAAQKRNPAGRGPRKTKRKGGNVARKMPARNAKGRFVKGGGRKRSRSRKRRRNPVAAAPNPPRRRRRRSSAKRATTRRRRSYRRNPPRMDILDRLVAGAQDAGYMLAGEAATRIGHNYLGGLVGFPTTGNMGLATKAAVAALVGYGAEYALGADAARFVTAGALAVPLKDAALRTLAPTVPMLNTAFTPTLAGFPRGRRLAGYARPALGPGGAAGGGYNYSGLGGYDYAQGAAYN